MMCPACGQDLKDVRVDSTVLDACTRGCGGLWFDLGELKTLAAAPEYPPELLQIEARWGLTVNLTGPRACPRCGKARRVVMVRRFHSPRRQVEVDECPTCGGIWLDGGELARIREEGTAKKPGGRPPTAWEPPSVSATAGLLGPAAAGVADAIPDPPLPYESWWDVLVTRAVVALIRQVR